MSNCCLTCFLFWSTSVFFPVSHFNWVSKFPTETANHAQPLQWIQLVLYQQISQRISSRKGGRLYSSTPFLLVQLHLLCRMQKQAPAELKGGHKQPLKLGQFWDTPKHTRETFGTSFILLFFVTAI